MPVFGRGRPEWHRVPGQRLECLQQGGLVGLDGEHVVRSGGGDRCGGVVLGVHRIDGDHASVQVSGVEPGQEIADSGDLVRLRGHRVLAQHDATVVVQRRDQVRRGRGAGAGTTHGLAVDRDHPATLDLTGPTPRQDSDLAVQRGGVEAGEQLAHRGLDRCPVQSESVELVGVEVQSPFPDRDERPGAGQDRAYRDSEYPRERVANPARVPGIGNLAQHAEQRVIELSGAGGSDQGRWHERVWSLRERVGVRTSISVPSATPATHATPVTPLQTRRSQPYTPPDHPAPTEDQVEDPDKPAARPRLQRRLATLLRAKVRVGRAGPGATPRSRRSG